MKRDRIFKYITYAQVRDALACGLIAVIPNGYHRQLHAYGIVMEWLCDCKMVRPRP